MAATLAPRVVGGAERVPWTPESLARAIDSGFLDGETHYEILGGAFYIKMGQNWPHSFAVDALVLAFRHVDLTRFHYSIQMSLRMGADMPEPDFQVVRGSLRSRRSIPVGAEALLVVEVADSTIAFDRQVKAPLYASAGIPTYWVVDLTRSRVEVHSRPEDGAYAEVRIFESEETLPSAFEGCPAVPVAELLAPVD